MPSERFTVLVATDGSAPATAMLKTVVGFPWPRGTRASGVVAAEGWLGRGPAGQAHEVLERMLAATASEAVATLAGRWPGVEVSRVAGPPADGILRQARRRRATVIAVGSSGRGRLDRLVVGSVSTAVVRRATCSVLVVKGRPSPIRRVVLGFDGSTNAWRAVDLVTKLAAPAGNRLTLVRAVEPERASSVERLPPAGRRIVEERTAVLNEQALAAARRDVERAAARLARRGWTVRADVRLAAAASAVLDAAETADLLVVGARGAGGLRGLLIGSVADRALHGAAASVLVVR
ncbi:MAG: universal stress protein [Candidatus Rokuibacteriota bacterium]